MEQNIIEGNKLIAEFMDQTVKAQIDRTLYHSDWNELMPVVEKIEKDFVNDIEVKIYSCSCYFDKWDGKQYNSFISGVGSKIQAVWQAVVEFIQWHNSTLNPEVSDTTDDESSPAAD